MQTKVTPGQIVVMAAGGVALIASFLPFWEFDTGFGDDSRSAWGEGLFPVATLIMLYCLAAAVLVALAAFANVNLSNVAGFGLVQIVLALSGAAALLALAFLILDTQGVDKAFGYFLLLLASLASVVGSILLMTETRTTGAGPGRI